MVKNGEKLEKHGKKIGKNWKTMGKNGEELEKMGKNWMFFSGENWREPLLFLGKLVVHQCFF